MILIKFFNPKNFNIQEVGKKYLYTLQMGRESIMRLNREQKRKKGGKRKTRINKRKCRKCKNKTKIKRRK